MSSTREQVDWNAELVRGDLAAAVRQLQQEPGNGLSWEARSPRWRSPG